MREDWFLFGGLAAVCVLVGSLVWRQPDYAIHQVGLSETSGFASAHVAGSDDDGYTNLQFDNRGNTTVTLTIAGATCADAFWYAGTDGSGGTAGCVTLAPHQRKVVSFFPDGGSDVVTIRNEPNARLVVDSGPAPQFVHHE